MLPLSFYVELMLRYAVAKMWLTSNKLQVSDGGSSFDKIVFHGGTSMKIGGRTNQV